MADDFNPTPIDWDYGNQDEAPYPIYSDEDQCELDLRYANKRAKRFAEAMRGHLMGIESARRTAEQYVERSRRELIQAEGDDWWQMIPAEKREDLRDSAMVTIRQVELEAQQVYAQMLMAKEVMRSTADAELKMIEDHAFDSLRYQLQGHIYGHRHEPIVRSKTGELSVTVPTTWWQMFKRDVLKCKQVQMVEYHREHTLTVSAVPFTAFPELPYKAPDTWGPRVRMMLPQRSTMSAANWITGPVV